MGLISPPQCHSPQQALSSLLLQSKEGCAQEPVFTLTSVWLFLLDMESCIWESTPAGQSAAVTSQMPSVLSNTRRFPLPFCRLRCASVADVWPFHLVHMLFPRSVIHCYYMWPDAKNFSLLSTAGNTLLLHTPNCTESLACDKGSQCQK